MPRTRSWATTCCPATGKARGAPLHREREQLRAPLGPAESFALGQGRVPPVRRAGESGAVNPAKTGTKAAARYILDVPAGGSSRLSACGCVSLRARSAAHRSGTSSRLRRAARRCRRVLRAHHAPSLSEDERRVHRQALAGMLWAKQYYLFDVDTWLKEHDAHPLLGGAARQCATPSGSTCSTATSSPCPTSGSIPGTRPGTWRSTPFRWRSSISTSPRSSFC